MCASTSGFANAQPSAQREYGKIMEYSFPHYLLSKQSVDDRALNKDVFEAIKYNTRKHLFDPQW